MVKKTEQASITSTPTVSGTICSLFTPLAVEFISVLGSSTERSYIEYLRAKILPLP